METQQQVPENILDRIAKLMAKAKSAESIGSQAEAEAFAAKAHELCNQYNLELQDVEQKGEKPQVGDFVVDENSLYIKNEGDWLFWLWRTIANHNYCQIVKYMADKKQRVSGIGIFGKHGNIEIVKYIVDQLSSKGRILAKKSYSNYARSYIGNNLEKRNTYIRGFFKGYVTGIDDRLREQQHQELKINENLQGLVVANRALIRQYIDQKLGATFHGYTKPTKSTGRSGKEDGYKVGKNTSINKGVSGATNSFNQRLLN